MRLESMYKKKIEPIEKIEEINEKKRCSGDGRPTYPDIDSYDLLLLNDLEKDDEILKKANKILEMFTGEEIGKATKKATTKEKAKAEIEEAKLESKRLVDMARDL